MVLIGNTVDHNDHILTTFTVLRCVLLIESQEILAPLAILCHTVRDLFLPFATRRSDLTGDIGAADYIGSCYWAVSPVHICVLTYRELYAKGALLALRVLSMLVTNHWRRPTAWLA